MLPDHFRCYLVTKGADCQVAADITERPLSDLPAHEVLIRVAYSSLNYKDALAATGHPGVVRRFPHVPGVDAAGTVVEDSTGKYSPGTEVLVTGYELGSGQWGGYGQFIRVPADWVVSLPSGLTAREAMILGTAGFTAARCVRAIQHAGVVPNDGDVLVTGATGGVAGLAISLLSRLGYRVIASTGKSSAAELLKKWGATAVIGRDDVLDKSGRPLVTARWSAAVDTVGGKPLADVLKAVNQHGCVAACGVVAGHDLPTTVYPFILRGVTLAGIDSASTPKNERLTIWNLLAGDWKLSDLEERAVEVGLDGLNEKVSAILQGQIVGRILVGLES
jgi:acrylyl-CoA reductase (NADPH)